MSKPKRKRRTSLAGRLVEGLANAILILVVLAFGISIAARFGPAEERKHREEAAAKAASHETAERKSVPASTEELRDRPTVDIRNGCGRVGLAEELAQRMRRTNLFDVVEYRTANRYDYEKTLVKDRTGKPGAARQVRDWLQREYGVGQILEERIPAPEADVLVILGADLADTLRRLERK
jgi:hypothetical protein